LEEYTPFTLHHISGAVPIDTVFDEEKPEIHPITEFDDTAMNTEPYEHLKAALLAICSTHIADLD